MNNIIRMLNDLQNEIIDEYKKLKPKTDSERKVIDRITYNALDRLSESIMWLKQGGME